MSAISEILSIALDHHRSGRLGTAISIYRQIIEADPSQPDPFHLLGVIARQNGKHELALDFIRHAIELKGDSEIFHNNLGGAYLDLRRNAEAVACFRRAIEISPSYAIAHNNLGGALIEQGLIDEAANCFRSAIRHKPNYAEAHSNLLLTLQYDERISLEQLYKAHLDFDRQQTKGLQSSCPTRSRSQAKPRWGFVSADLGRHPVGYFLAGVLENLAAHGIETFCYSDRTDRDDLTQRIQTAVHEWREVVGIGDEELADLIRRDNIDILFDLGGHTARNRLLVFARKPAPIQISWAGYVGTTGLKTMDYLLADALEIPSDAERYYRERVLRMPHGYVCYEPPSYAPPVSSLPALSTGHVTFGCFNNPIKLSSRIISVWTNILHRVPDSRLVLKHKIWNDPGIVERFSHRFAETIDPGRIQFLEYSPHRDLLAHYHQIDIALDPLPYTGGLTTCEALWMGVPVITCPGDTFAGRHSLSHLSNIGLTQTIAKDLDEYVELAVQWAKDLQGLSALRSGLRERMAASPLCDIPRFTSDLVALLTNVERQHAKTTETSHVSC